VVVIGLNTAEPDHPADRARRFRDGHKLTFPILVDADGKARATLGVTAFPTNLVIDGEGNVRYFEPGFNQGAIDRVLRELKDRPPQTPSGER
jgi:peroxiredoxin